ncbi:PREDICTED: nucleoporin NDC1 isoform X1 [Ceratotherium simum simum]|uniref:Nucleoporin NDC1 n=1 Tax=Ceratotherium simum simum TaxID=73337 RepID=A0ABM0I218_CERSS|nr:PREDICTED: nucleoporin NDC1 isoform X1 [Ceratotherium simum simum]
MQRRPQFQAPRRTLLRRDLLDSRGRVLESQLPWGHVSTGQFWPVRPVRTKPQRDGLGRGPGFPQAAFEAVPPGSSWGLPPFELRWRAASSSPAPLRVGATITMATAASRPCAGGSRDILWRVLGWRIVASIVCSVLLLPVCTTVFIIFSSVDLFHPIQWLSDSFNDLYSSYVILYLLLLSVVIVVISIFNVEFYTVVPSIPCSRLALIGKILHPQQLMHSFIHAAMGMMMAWCAAVISKGRYSFLVVPCTGTESLESRAAQTCLNEYHLFFLLAGAFMGYSYSLLYFINNMNYLPFPIIQQYKFLRFRRSLPLLVKHSCVESLFLIRNFCIVYYFLGHIPKAWISTAMDLQIDEQFHRPLDTVSGLLNLSLLYHVWLCGVFLLMTWYVSWILFKIYATEAHLFPVQAPFAEESDECLPKVLNSNPPLIVKYLALQDLMLLSQYSPSRRQEVFSLSQPGGHPHNWTAISRECLNLLNDMTQKLVLYQEAAATNGRVMSSSYPVETKKLSFQEETTFQTPKSNQMPRPSVPPLVKTSLFSSKLSTPDVASPLGTPFGSSVMNRMAGIFDVNTCYGSPQSPQLVRRGPRLWTSASDQQMTEFSNLPSTTVSAEGKTVRQPSVIYSWIQNKREQIKNFLSKRVLIMYFFSKHPEASIQAVFSDAQMHIWALEGLSHLVAASFTEDRFGVVQTTLPAILNTLLTLQEAVDKYFKLPHASSKPPRISGSLVDTSYKTLRFAFRASLKTAIYRITTTFGEHLNAVQASAEHQKRLQQFLEFKE